MCGLCGVIGPAGRSSSDDLVAMTRSLAHRGPDDEGTWTARFPVRNSEWQVGLGHTRLSILDLSQAGHQPMLSQDGRHAIVYNGEIYNHRALRAELERGGVHFRSDCDTEVVLEAWRAWGTASVERLTGMFAFAIWDSEHDRLALVRDRFGIKPLHYGICGDCLVFGSELRAFREHPEFRPRIDPTALQTYLRFGWLTGERTIYGGVQRVLPGHVVTWKDGSLTQESFWRLSDYEPEGGLGDFESVVDTLDEKLGAAVEARLISDVPLGAFLSGGVDSSAIVALMKERAQGAVKTFAIGFKDAAFDEAPYARRVADYLGTEHTELYVDRAHARDVIRDLPTLYDEPFSDPSAVPTVLLSRLTREHVTVALSGDGGDELFGGYSRYQRLARLLPLMALPRGLRRALSSIGSPFLPRSIRNGLAKLAAAGDDAELSESFLAGFGEELLAEACRGAGPREPAYRSVFESASGGALRRAMYAEARTYLNDDILVKVDRASMSVGLEARVPILDHHVAELAFRLPASILQHGGQSKAPLRELLYRRVPRELIERGKHGFSFPIRSLLGPELERWTKHYLATDRIAEEELLDPDAVQRMLAYADSGAPAGDSSLWRLLCFERWFAVNHRAETGD